MTIEGTFEGTLTNDAGETITITEGYIFYERPQWCRLFEC